MAIVGGFHTSSLTAANGFSPDGAHGVLAAVATSGIIFSYLGFERADQPAGESTNPKRDLPIAVIGSILLGLVIYISRQIVSPGGTGLIYTAASSRASYGLSRNGYVPTIFEHLSKRRVPWFDVVTAFVVSNLIILWSGWDTDWKLGIAILIGYVILIANRVFNLNPIEPRLNRRARQWLPVYLVGMGLIVYLSDFGPLTNPWFLLGRDVVVVAVFSPVIFSWVVAVSLKTEEIEGMIIEVVVPEEETSVL